MKTKLVYVDKSADIVHRGVYSGPILEPDPRTPPEFYLTEQEKLIVIDIVESGYQLSCDTLTRPGYWQDDWTRCPLCGTRPDDNVWVHNGDQ